MLLLDFYYFYAAGRIASRGENPYDGALLHSEMLQIGWPVDRWTTVFPYAPWTLEIWAIFAQLPFLAAACLWIFCSAASVLFYCLQLIDRSDIRKRGVPAALLVLASFLPWWKLTLFGQTTWLLALGIGGFIYLIGKGQRFLAGAALSLVSVKPHVAALFVLGVLIIETRSRRWHSLAGVACGFLTLLLGALALVPNGYGQFMDSLLQNAKFHAGFPNPSFAYALSWLVPASAANVICLLAGAGVTARIALCSAELQRAFLPLILCSLCFSPYLWSHDLVLLLPHYWHLVLAVQSPARKRSSRSVFPALLGAFQALLIYAGGEPMMIIFLAVLTALFLWFSRGETPALKDASPA